MSGQQKINRDLREALKRLGLAKASFYQAVVADDSPLTVTFRGADVLALGIDGTGPYTIGDRVTVAAWQQNVLVLGRASSAPGGGSGGVTLPIAESDVTGLTTDLAAKLVKASNLSDLANAGTARTNLGLGSLATLSTINGGNWSGTDLAVTDGGTGASTASGARTNLGLVIGTDVQAFAGNLAAFAALTLATDKLPYANGSGTLALTDFTTFARQLLDDTSFSAMRTTLGLAIGTDVQAYSAVLASLAALSGTSDRLPYMTAANTYALATFTSAGRALVDDATAGDQRTTLGLGTSSVLDVPASGDATSGQVVKGSDTRLTDARSPTAGSVVNASVSSSAAIAYSKLALTGAILNADLAGSIAYNKLSLTGAILNADLAGSIAYSKLVLTASIVNGDIASGAAIAYSKLALTGAILNADLAGSIAYSKLVLTGSVTNADLAGSIANTKLATDPLARANHTGTQLASTVSNFDTQVRTSTLNQMATPTTDLAIGSHKITGLTAGSATGQAVEYDQLNAAVSAATSGLSLKNPVSLASTANLTTTSSTSTTLTGSATLLIDGKGLDVGDRALLKNQTTGADNGIYTATTGGGTFGGAATNFGGVGTFGGTSPWTLTRATDADVSAEVVTGMFVPVTGGATNLQTSWILTTAAPITLATTSLVFAQWTATPVGTAGGDLTGSYPNPTLAAGKRDFGLVTALPGSPSTGDRCTYTDSLTSPTYTWRLQYNGSDAGSFKWEFLGGSALRAEVDTDQSTTSATYIALTTPCSVTAPLAGDYDVTHGGEAYISAAAPAATIQNVKIGGAALSTDVDGATVTPQVINAAQTATRKRRKTGLTASTAIALQHRTTSGTCQWRYRWVEIQPVRVG